MYKYRQKQHISIAFLENTLPILPHMLHTVIGFQLLF